MNRTIRQVAIAAAGLATTVTLAACGGGSATGTDHQNMPGMGSGASTTSASPSASSGTGTAAARAHNAADVSFATGMIPHHAQAVTMAEMATTRATNAQVTSLAAAIKAAQAPEIATMTGWLTAWGQPVPATTGGHDMSSMGTAGHDMSSMGGAPGMMTDQEMQQLSTTTGAPFDRMWLDQMIRHHQGAVTMARTEVADGQAPEAKQLAQRIADSQSAEIATMTALLPTITG